MRKLKLKVCGMKEPDNIREVAKRLPDYMGFIFYPKSPRFVGHSFGVPEDIPESIRRVGVMVKPEIKEVIKWVNDYHLDYVQLHGDESASFCRELKERDISIIKVFRVDATFDFEQTTAFEQVVDYFLFDTKGDQYGGTGKAFDWSRLQQYHQRVPFFLSGGLHVDRLSNLEVLKGMHLHALDVNSGIESAPGLKDLEKLDLLINELKKL